MERSAFPPIADYGFLSDCEVAALVAPSGNVEWLCLPQFDSPSVFGSMLDRDAGRFRFGPADAQPFTRSTNAAIRPVATSIWSSAVAKQQRR